MEQNEENKRIEQPDRHPYRKRAAERRIREEEERRKQENIDNQTAGRKLADQLEEQRRAEFETFQPPPELLNILDGTDWGKGFREVATLTNQINVLKSKRDGLISEILEELTAKLGLFVPALIQEIPVTDLSKKTSDDALTQAEHSHNVPLSEVSEVVSANNQTEIDQTDLETGRIIADEPDE